MQKPQDVENPSKLCRQKEGLSVNAVHTLRQAYLQYHACYPGMRRCTALHCTAQHSWAQHTPAQCLAPMWGSAQGIPPVEEVIVDPPMTQVVHCGGHEAGQQGQLIHHLGLHHAPMSHQHVSQLYHRCHMEAADTNGKLVMVACCS